MCTNTNYSDAQSHVPNFSIRGFEEAAELPALQGVHALQVKACVAASYDPNSKQICVDIPIFGKRCFSGPGSIPVGGALKVCLETCGGIIPKGAKGTLYVNDQPIWTGVIFGSC